MRNVYHRLSFLALALSAFFMSEALDLPVKTVDGHEVFYYKVGKKETVYGIAKHLGITPEEIVRHNPDAADGIKRGMMLYFPFEEYAAIDSSVGRELAEDTVADADSIYASNDTVIVKDPSIALLLPFGLSSEEPTRSNKLALDFYKGFLLGADTLAERSGTIKIFAFDTEAKDTDLSAILARQEVADAAVIVAPNDKDALETIATNAAERGTRVLNVFLVHDSLYLTNPMMLQANIPQRQMYKLAADAFLSDYAGYTPLILRNTTGKNEKEGFVSYLTERMREKGIEPQMIEYDGNLLASSFESLPVSNGERYVVVPSSGTLAEFNKFAYTLKSFRDRLTMVDTEAEDYDPLKPLAKLAVFGYPDWTAFRGDALDMLHKLEAAVYSRFFDDFAGFASRTLENDFKYWYGEGFIESVPSQAILGYDTARFLIKNIRANGGAFDPVFPLVFEGIQSTFEFEKTGEGYCNSTLYILNYRPDGRIDERTI